MGLVPLVELGLQAIALGQQGLVLRRQVGDDGREPVPEAGRVDADVGQDLFFDELVKLGSDLQGAGRDALGHGNLSLGKMGSGRRMPQHNHHSIRFVLGEKEACDPKTIDFFA